MTQNWPGKDTMNLNEIDLAIAGAKARFDHADGPYEPDVLALIRAAEAMREKLYGPVGDDPMPVFVIKGKDRLAPDAVHGYFTLCLSNGLPAQAAEVADAEREICGWQDRHPELVKTPDHEHVPVTSTPDGLRRIEHDGRLLKVVTRDVHDRRCISRVATLQEGTDPEVLHCAACGFCYPSSAPDENRNISPAH